jgi:hypothetical protein
VLLGRFYSELPPRLQEKTAMNFFYIEFINGFASELQQQLCKVIDEEIAGKISDALYWTLLIMLQIIVQINVKINV